MLGRVLKGKQEGFELEHRIVRLDGKERIILTHAQVVRNDDGTVVRMYGYNQDITERRQNEEQQKAQEQLLLQQSKMAAMGEMMGAIAHQWKQPLNALAITVQDLEDAYEFGELDKQYLQNVISNTMRQVHFMSHTIDDFRDFFKPSKTKKPFRVDEAVTSMINLVEVQYQHRGIELRFEKPSALTVLGFPNEFKQVMLNLLNNARDAIEVMKNTEAAPQKVYFIDVTIKKKKDEAVVTVQDYAGGVPESLGESIFEPYVTTKGEEGTGIGLSMSRTIVENNMGGTLRYKNQKEGACFMITLPLAPN